MSAPPVIELRSVSKRFGPVRALRRLDFALGPGETVALLGANGAGKSTLLRVVAGLARPDAGSVLVHGRPATEDPARARQRIGFLSHDTMLYESLSARENLAFTGRIHGVANLRLRIDQLLRALDLLGRADDPVRTLSRGTQQRVALARVLIHDPEILLLDEPFTGLDRDASRTLGALLGAVKRRGRSVVLVTHDLDRVVGLADRVAVLSDGRIQAESSATNLDATGIEAFYAQSLDGGQADAGAVLAGAGA